MKVINKIFLLIFILGILISAQDKKQEILLQSREDGFIPVWLATGPFEYPLYGFGLAKDTTAIGEPFISPVGGEYVISSLPEKEKNLWIQQSINDHGYIDFKKSLEWNVNTKVPVKIWYARAGYAFTTIISENEKEAFLSLGSNSNTAVYLNGERVFAFNDSRNAIPDQNKIKVKLKQGKNELIIRVLNTHKNLGIAFFGTLKWEWGFYARLLDNSGNPLQDIEYLLNVKDKDDFNVLSTFYFKTINGELKQRIDLEINSFYDGNDQGVFTIKAAGNTYEFKIDSIRFGKTRHSIYLPEIVKDINAESELKLKWITIKKKVLLQKQQKFTLHLMLLNHTDIGYTHTQPVCEELHCTTLDDVVKMCREYPDFHWTIETTWQLEAYEKLRSKDRFLELMSFIKAGRIAVSPIYTNPFTGYVSEEEMLRSFDKAVDFRNRFGISYSASVYNDVPGQSWFLPQVLNKAGIKLVAEGINEVYGDYKLQRNLPKVFKWEGADGSQVVTYLNEAYNEGKSYGLESGDLFCVEQSIFERITKLQARNYKPDIILINSSFSDNSILAAHQYHLAKKWNELYEYPKFISSDVNIFAEELLKSEAYKDLPVFRGDWTSNWDIFYQGEFERHRDARKTQHQLLTAEKLSTLSSLKDSNKLAMNNELNNSYKSLLLFSGHGSGLEYGYGSPEDNKLTMQYRQNYTDNAFLGAEEVTLKSIQQITKPEESLESEAVYLFNSLSWNRSGLVEIRYTFDLSPEYDIIDPITNKIVPSFRDGHIQYFVAKDIPSLGYCKYMLKPKKSNTAFNTELSSSLNTIENQYYKIALDTVFFNINSIIDKKTGRELVNEKSSFSFSKPCKEKYQLNESMAVYNPGKISYEIIKQSPIRLILRINRPDDIFENIEFELVDGIDKVLVNTTADQSKLTPVKNVIEYGLPFSFNSHNAEVKAEILGGYVDFTKDRLPGVDHDGASLRRSVSIYNNDINISWATSEARVIRVRKDSLAGVPVIISNPLNNFPDEWNRHENKSGKIEFHYAFTTGKGIFNPGKTTALGYELNTPIEIRKSWFGSVPASEEFINIDNQNIQLLNFKSGANGKILRLINTDSENQQKANISSKLFKNFSSSIIDIFGNKVRDIPVKENMIPVLLKPGEYTDILINNNNQTIK